MIPSDFEYYAPRSLREALDLLARNSDAKVLGGGMSLIPALKHRLQTPAALVDLGRVPELESVSERRGKIAIGGRSTHRSLAQSDEIADVHALRETASAIGDVQVRTAGPSAGAWSTPTRRRTGLRCSSRSTARRWSPARAANARSRRASSSSACCSRRCAATRC